MLNSIVSLFASALFERSHYQGEVFSKLPNGKIDGVFVSSPRSPPSQSSDSILQRAMFGIELKPDRFQPENFRQAEVQAVWLALVAESGQPFVILTNLRDVALFYVKETEPHAACCCCFNCDFCFSLFIVISSLGLYPVPCSLVD